MLLFKFFTATGLNKHHYMVALLCLNFCNTDTENLLERNTVALVYYIQTSLYGRSHENTICSAAHYECVLEPCCWWAEEGWTPPHLFLPLAVTMAITAQLLMTSAFFPHSGMTWNSAEFNFKETTLLFYAKKEVKSQVNLSLKASSNMHLLIFYSFYWFDSDFF